MRFVDMEDRLPTDSVRWKSGGWTPMTRDEWESWKSKSDELHNQISELEARGRLEERNQVIEKNKAHWGRLKPWLEDLSFGKCWFTEARDCCSYLTVEHFRPKKKALNLDGTDRGGYWWLAFDYKNFRLAGDVPNKAKGVYFPLHDGSPRSSSTNRCEESEVSCLLDPIKVTDAKLLAFQEDGEACPRPGISLEWDKNRVRISIERYNLNGHPALSEGRKDIFRKMTLAINEYLTADAKHSPSNPVATQKAEAAARKIRELVSPETPFSSAAWWCAKLRNEPAIDILIG